MAKLKDLAEFYTKAAAMKDPVIKSSSFQRISSPTTMSNIDDWTVEERQPDFQCLIDSGIDCEFSDNGKTWDICKLSKVNVSDKVDYIDIDDCYWNHCRPRLNHIHAWIATEDSKCPVPDGYLVKAYCSNDKEAILCDPKNSCWSSNGNAQFKIVAFEVLPL